MYVSAYIPEYYEITNGTQFFYAIGVAHLYDIKHLQFKLIKNKWEQFLKDTNRQNCIVLVEGGKSRIFKDLKTAVAESGENGFITSLAVRAGIKTFSPEPDDVYEVNCLLKKFTRDQIMFYYFNRLYIQWSNAYKPMKFEAYIQRQFDNYQRMLSWKDYDFAVKHFINIHNHRKDHKFNKDACVDCLYKYDPDIQGVEKNSVKIRDKHILREILRIWNNGKNIFVVYGGGHTENWKDKLKKKLVNTCF